MKGAIPKLLAATVLLCAGLSLMIGCGILAFVDKSPLSPPVAIFGFVLGGGITFASWKWMTFVNRAWADALKEKFEDEPGETLARWEVPLGRWRKLAKWKRRKNAEQAPYTGGCFGLLLFAMITGTSWSLVGPEGAIILGLVVGALSGGLTFWIVSSKKVFGLAAAEKAGRGEVQIRPGSMLLNDELVVWGGMNGSLSKFSCKVNKELGFPVLEIEIERSTGRTTHTIEIAVPVDESQAETIANLRSHVRRRQ